MVDVPRDVSCAICDSNEAIILYRLDSTTVVRCKQCGLVYMKPQPSYREILHLYTQKDYEAHYRNYMMNFKEFLTDSYCQGLQTITALKCESGRVLDVGSSFGFFLDMAVRQGFQAIGVDIA